MINNEFVQKHFGPNYKCYIKAITTLEIGEKDLNDEILFHVLLRLNNVGSSLQHGINKDIGGYLSAPVWGQWHTVTLGTHGDK